MKLEVPRCAICRYASAQKLFTGGSIYRCTLNDNIKVKAKSICNKYSKREG